MSALTDLIEQVNDQGLRERLLEEASRLEKQKKFGLVFEEHLPECTPLYDIPVKKGSTVARKKGNINEIFTVIEIKESLAVCVTKNGENREEIPLKELVTVAEFGTPIYPCLQMIDSVSRAPESDLWHALIEADNYHALQLLEYLYAGKVDCIYIDPPYNSGAKDWKYNNDYVDSNDSYRHSKWLSMMQKRLKIAKRLLNPADSVLIVTIDEKEYLHLGCLLEEMFPEARIQMISDVINPKGVARSGFRRNDEYIFFVMLGSSMPARIALGAEWSSSALLSNLENTGRPSKTPGWTSMMRRGSHSSRQERPGLYFPIYVSPDARKIVVVGEPLPMNLHKGEDIEGLVQVLPIRSNGDEGCWQIGPQELKKRIEQGRIKIGKETSYGFVINYLPDGAYQELFSDSWQIEGRDFDGALIARYIGEEDSEKKIAPTQWKISTHNASENGSSLIKKMLCNKRFEFPKSLYSEKDAINFFVANKPNALIVDFFAGSGTTLHAVNLLNAEDGGKRRCIMVTNNEVSAEEATALTAQGYQPGDAEWEKLGIARYVNWPRTVCSIEGHDVNGNPLKGNYLGSDLPMADGFKANAVFFKLGFLDKNAVALGRQFKNLLSILWMKAGAYGPCPVLNSDPLPDVLMFAENRFAVLTQESAFAELETALAEHPEIETVYIITDYEAGYCAMAKNLKVKYTYQLYRDYLDNFRINTERN